MPSGRRSTSAWQDNATNETGFVVERSTGRRDFAQIDTVGANVDTLRGHHGRPAATTLQVPCRGVRTLPASATLTSNSVVSCRLRRRLRRTGRRRCSPRAEDPPRSGGQRHQRDRLHHRAVHGRRELHPDRPTGLPGRNRQHHQPAILHRRECPAGIHVHVSDCSHQRVREVGLHDLGSGGRPDGAGRADEPDRDGRDRTQASLAWTDTATNETGFKIERSTNGGAFSQIATVGANSVTYPDTTIQPGFTYTYQVRATNAAIDSAYSNTATLVVPARPAAPTALAAGLIGGPQMRLTWRDNATTETGFILERSTNGGAFVQVAQVALSAGSGLNVTYTDPTILQPGSTYRYRVAAINAFVLSAYSTFTAVTLPALPGTPTISSVTTVRNGTLQNPTVNWGDVTGETGYTIQWSATKWGGTAGGGSAAANAITSHLGTSRDRCGGSVSAPRTCPGRCGPLPSGPVAAAP